MSAQMENSNQAYRSNSVELERWVSTPVQLPLAGVLPGLVVDVLGWKGLLEVT